jgi:hypothetical protein
LIVVCLLSFVFSFPLSFHCYFHFCSHCLSSCRPRLVLLVTIPTYLSGGRAERKLKLSISVAGLTVRITNRRPPAGAAKAEVQVSAGLAGSGPGPAVRCGGPSLTLPHHMPIAHKPLAPVGTGHISSTKLESSVPSCPARHFPPFCEHLNLKAPARHASSSAPEAARIMPCGLLIANQSSHAHHSHSRG